ncbi:MAG: hypothetical protein IPM29_21070 [Planctomycetes bacterium]|nr:hypothetical protein [Planctomycetota bacterium]
MIDRSFERLRWRDFLAGLCESRGFREQWSGAIRDCGHDAVRWETAAVCARSLDRPFASVLLPSAALARLRADPSPFAEHLRGVEQVATFTNLGGDAELVVPAATGDYPHLCAFVRSAPPEQIDALWSAVGVAMRRRLAASPRPVWLNTAGLGVSWLHVRLDAQPKYYVHGPFRQPPDVDAPGG